ncbi:MAG: hypothetical protein Q4G68_08065 [Planctomycetia bacterium]|nr:hypothetical protein [Planctomycetia bacterium]
MSLRVARLLVAVLAALLGLGTGSEFVGVTLAEESLHRVWTTRISARFDDMPLSEFLEQRSQSVDFVWFIDRRLDPGMPISGSLTNLSLREGLDQLAAENELGLCFFDRLVYIGTRQSAGELLLLQSILRDELKQSPGPAIKRLMADCPLTYSEFSEPQKILEQLAGKIRFRWSKLELMPHDCWRANELPPLPACDLISLLLLGFNVRLAVDAENSILTPAAIDREQILERVWTGPDLPNVERLRNEFPECEFQTARRSGVPTLTASGTFTALARIEYEVALADRLASSESDAPGETTHARRATQRGTPPSQKTISGKIQNTALKTVFEFIEKDHGLRLLLDDSLQSAGVTPETRITCEFNNAGEEEILNTIAGELKASWRKDGKTATFYLKR